MSVRVKHILVSVMMICCAAGCAPTIRVTRHWPAEIDLSAYKKIAVGMVSGQNGEEISSLLEKSLAGSGRFEVVGRRGLGGVLRGQNLSSPDPLDPAALAKLGVQPGSSALVSGRVTKHQYSATPFMYSTVHMVNSHAQNVMGYKLVGYWLLEVELSVVDIPTGQVLAVKTYGENLQDSVIDLEGVPDPTWDEGKWFPSLYQAVVDEFVKQTGPWTENLVVHLYKAGSLPSVQKGIASAMRQDWAPAIEQFSLACGAADKDPAIPSEDRAHAHYDLGVALGYSGTSYERAIQEIQNAVDIDAEDTYFEEMKRIKKFQDGEERLKGLGKNTGKGQSLQPVIVPAG
jgi:curli biogenesis system outer membrane secretion channel CsgG